MSYFSFAEAGGADNWIVLLGVTNLNMADDSEENELLETLLQPERLSRLEQVLGERSRSLTVVLDRVQNFHNISAVMRSADAFGVTELHLIGDEFEYSPKITQGTERWVDLRRYASSEQAAAELRRLGYKLVILAPEAAQEGRLPSIPITALPFEERLALVFGNEKDGVSETLQKAAGIHAYIPMKGFVESLNISVACAITLFCSCLAPTQPARRTVPLDESEREEMRSSWLRKSVKRSEVILRAVGHRKEWV